MRSIPLLRWANILALVIITLVPLTAQSTGLAWKLVFLRWTKGDMESLPFARPIALQDGTQFQVLVAMEGAGYAYVLYEDTNGSVAVLFQGEVKEGQLISLPSEKKSFQVTPPDGTERIHVVVAKSRQAALEGLLKRLPTNSQTVIDELARMKATLSTVAEAPEKPVPMGGTFRTMPDMKVAEFTGQDSYVKTIRLDH
jgi:hypothetical protein